MKVLSNKELSTFCSQMALILRSGISSTEGLSIMLEDAPQEEGQQILKTVLEQIEPLDLSGGSRCFPQISVRYGGDWGAGRPPR